MQCFIRGLSNSGLPKTSFWQKCQGNAIFYKGFAGIQPKSAGFSPARARTRHFPFFLAASYFQLFPFILCHFITFYFISTTCGTVHRPPGSRSRRPGSAIFHSCGSVSFSGILHLHSLSFISFHLIPFHLFYSIFGNHLEFIVGGGACSAYDFIIRIFHYISEILPGSTETYHVRLISSYLVLWTPRIFWLNSCGSMCQRIGFRWEIGWTGKWNLAII